MSKRFFPAFLLLIFLANVVGFNLATLFQLTAHQYTSRENEKEKIVTLKIPVSETTAASSGFEWLEEDEFTFHGRRYDVISSAEINGVLVMTCYDDTKEDFLYKKLEEQTSTNENKQPVKGKQTFLKKGIEYDHAEFLFSFSTPFSTCELIPAPLFESLVFRPVASPPPWLG
jgi:hypothetical protein